VLQGSADFDIEGRAGTCRAGRQPCGSHLARNGKIHPGPDGVRISCAGRCSGRGVSGTELHRTRGPRADAAAELIGGRGVLRPALFTPGARGLVADARPPNESSAESVFMLRALFVRLCPSDLEVGDRGMEPRGGGSHHEDSACEPGGVRRRFP